MKRITFLIFSIFLCFSYSFSQKDGCKLDIVLAFDVSGSNMGSGTCLSANEFLTSFLTVLDSEMDGSINGVNGNNNVQVGLCTWSTLDESLCDNGGQGFNVQVSPMTTSSSLLNNFATGSTVDQIIGIDVFGSDFYYAATHMGMQTLNDFANSSLGDRSAEANYQRILIIVTDANSDDACIQSTSGGPCAIDMQNDVWNFGVQTIAVAVRNSSGAPPLNWQSITSCLVEDPNDQYEGNGVTLSTVGIEIASEVCQPTFYVAETCLEDSTNFSVSQLNIDSVSWNFGDPASGFNNYSTNMSPTHIFSSAGTFTVTLITYINGIASDNIVSDVIIKPIPAVNLGNDTVMCEGEMLNLNASMQNATYLWQDNSTNSAYDVFNEGEYFVEITVDGCSNTDTINVIYNSLPQAVISGNHDICDGDKADVEIIVNGSSSPFEITYTNGSDTNLVYGNDSIIIEASQSGIYEITNVLDHFDCIGNYSGSAEIIINPCSLSVYVPSAFTPNIDDYNQVFIPSIYDIDDVVDYNIKIFNRWGEMIFETNDIGRHWDGRFNNTDAQQGVYVYIITVTDIYEKTHNLNGYVCLIR